MAKMVRILVVDRSRFSRETLAQVMRSQLGDVEVSTVESAAAALEYLASGQRVDLITTALALADMDGVDLVNQLRRMGRNNDIPVVVVSAEADERFKTRGAAPGVSEYFDKSDGFRRLIEFVKDFTNRNFVEGRILLVEDDMVAGKVTHQLLEKEGFKVLHTTSAEQAEDLLETMAASDGEGRVGTFFDLVLTDFFLEDNRTAANLLHLIRVTLHYSAQQLPVLVITGTDDVQRQIEVFRAGANDFVTKPFVAEVLATRVRSLLLVKKQFDVLQQQAHELHRLAVTDALTVVHNRRYLSEYGEDFLDDVANTPVGVLIVDIDFLSVINQEQGMLVGDAVLKAIGELMTRELGKDAVVVRFAGEEFCALLPACEALRLGRIASVLINAVVAERPAGLDVSISIGAASAADFPDEDLNGLMRKADQALAEAKSEGRKRACLHTKQGIVLV